MSSIKRYFVFVVTFADVILCVDGVPQETKEPAYVETNSLSFTPVPWVGVLVFKPNETAEETVAGVILINKKLAIANARDLAKIKKFHWPSVRNTTNVLFLTPENVPWFANVENISIHYEYNEDTLTSIGLLELEYDETMFRGEMLRWPNGMNNVSYAGEEIFVFGFTDRTQQLEQIVYRMDYISYSDCQNFYVHEELDSRWMRPTSYHCYRVRYKADPCVFDPGMALVHHFEGVYTLLGMSSWGPGCSLPARFLDFEYFLPWITTKMETRRQKQKGHNLRGDWRQYYEDVYAGPKPGDLDTWILQRLNDTKIVLQKITKPAKGKKLSPRLIAGRCTDANTQDKQLIYRDRMNFTSRFKGVKGIGVYGLSFYDLRFNYSRLSCVSVLAECSKISHSKLWYTQGLKQGHIFEDYVKITPLKIKKYNRPHIHYLEDTWWQYNFEVIGTNVTNLMFRFEFEEAGYLEVNFYGNKTKYDLVPTTTPKGMTTMNWLSIPRTPIGYRLITKYPQPPTTPHPNVTTITTTRATTNWWHKWWRYQGYPKIPGEEGGDVDWWKG